MVCGTTAIGTIAGTTAVGIAGARSTARGTRTIGSTGVGTIVTYRHPGMVPPTSAKRTGRLWISPFTVVDSGRPAVHYPRGSCGLWGVEDGGDESFGPGEEFLVADWLAADALGASDGVRTPGRSPDLYTASG